MVECGCPYVPPPSTHCKICGDDGEEDDAHGSSNNAAGAYGLVPEPMTLVNPTDAFTTCGVYEWEYSVSSVSEAECGAIRDRIGFTCGCRRKMVGATSHSRQSANSPNGLDATELFGAFAASLIIVVAAAIMLAFRQPERRTETREGRSGSVQGDVESSGTDDIVHVNSAYFKHLSTIYEDNEEDAVDEDGDMEGIMMQ